MCVGVLLSEHKPSLQSLIKETGCGQHVTKYYEGSTDAPLQ
jgi:hypothetical protein